MAQMTTNGNGFISRQNFQAALGGLSLLLILFGSFGSYVISTMGARIDELKTTVVTHSEHKQYAKRIDDALLRIDQTLLRIEQSIVPRGEHSEKWRANDTAFVNQQKQIDEIRRDLGASYSLGDKLKELQRQIEMLSRKN